MYIIKIGGGQNINWDYIAKDLKTLLPQNECIIVHGANGRMKETCEQLGIETKNILSPSGYTSRYTDQNVIDAMLMTYSGLINKRIVEVFQKNGINALGLSGLDGQLIRGIRKKVILSEENGKTKAIKDNLTGKAVEVNTDLLRLLLNNGYTPVICSPIISEENEIINADNDRIVAQIAKSLGVKKIISLFEAPGLLENPGDQNSLIHTIQAEEMENFMDRAENGMKMKVLGAVEALKAGVEQIYWGDGRIAQPITNALEGRGTVITNLSE